MKRNLSLIIAFALVIGANALSAMAEPDASALAPVTNFFSDYNKNDIAKASTLFLEELSVTDAFPPFYWQGRNAFKNWMAGLKTFNTKNKYTDYDFKVGKPLTQEVDADHANVIVPLVLDLKHGGKPERIDGLVNVVLQKSHDVWKIAALTWTTKSSGPIAASE